jgi:hypothetical protein
MFTKAFNPAPNESFLAVNNPLYGIAASNPQTISPQSFNPRAANNYLSLGTITMPAGVIRLEGTSVWKII